MPRSRGALVRDFVRDDAPVSAWLAKMRPAARDYGRFKLVLWDGSSLSFASNHPRYAGHAIAPGMHAMSNGAFDAPWPKSTHATQALSAWLASPASQSPANRMAIAPLLDALANTTTAPDAALPYTGVGLALERALSPPFVRGEHYGTRCSWVVLAGADAVVFAGRRYGPDARMQGESFDVLAIVEERYPLQPTQDCSDGPTRQHSGGNPVARSYRRQKRRSSTLEV